jgi:microcystin-dependent protein
MKVCSMLFLVLVLTSLTTLPVHAQVEPFLGEIRFVGFNFAPAGWAQCDGQLLPLNENIALFSLLGTNFGGDGISTFGLPDMQGRVPVGTGQGAGLTNRNLGEKSGQESVALTIAQMPKHQHYLRAASTSADSKAPAGNALATSPSAGIYSTQDPSTTKLNTASIAATGSSAPHENMQPFLGMTCIIATSGIFPARP